MSDDQERRRMVRPPTGGTPGGRGSVNRTLKTADKRTPSQQAWLNRQLNDPWSERARAEGRRSRAAYKLIQIDDRFRLIRKGSKVIDLGAAPGGWVQVALERGAGAVVGVDLLPMDPIEGAILIQADFTEPGVGERLVEELGGPPDVVLSDMAHNTVGHQRTDHLKIVALIEAAAAFAVEVLAPGGAFVTKNFQGGSAGDVLKTLKARFAEVKFVKPEASRKDSSEVYLVATGFKGPA